jgi:hypothetical protein
MDFTFKQVVVALESLGYQCQFLDGSLVAQHGTNQLTFVEDSEGNAVGTFPASLSEALGQITETQVEERFSQQRLTEMGYGEFSPSSAKPTGVDDVTGKSLGIDVGDQSVTNEQPQKGPKKPQNSTDLPGDFTGDSNNNDPAKVPGTGGSSKATTVGPHGAASTGKPGAAPDKKPEKTQAMKVGHSLQQGSAPDKDSGADYTGTEVGELGNAQGDGKGAGSSPSMGSSPAPLPSTQGAQALPKIPSPGKGKMTVSGATIEAILGEASPDQLAQQQDTQNTQIAQQNAGKKVYVVSRDAADRPWAVSGTFESTTPQSIEDAKESVFTFTQANPQGGSVVFFSEMDAEEVQQAIADGQQPQELGNVEIAQGKVEEGIGGAIARGAGAVARGAGKAAGAVARGAGKVAGVVGREMGSTARGMKGIAQGAGRAAGAVARGAKKAAGAVARGAQKVGQNVADMPASTAAVAGDMGSRAAKAVGADRTASAIGRGAARVAGGLEKATGGSREFEYEESFKARVLASLPESFNILAEMHPGPHLNRTTFKEIDLAEFERRITPLMARVILEQDDEEDPFAPPMPPEGGEGEDLPPEDEFGGEEGAPPEEDDAGMGGPEDVPPEGDMGEDPGAPIDIGPEPSPAPVGGEQGPPGIEPGAPEPEVPAGEESRYQQAKQMCPDCDETEIEQLVELGIVGDLYKAMVQRVAARSAEMKAQEEPMALAASQAAPNGSGRSDDRISVFERERRLSEAWKADRRGFVDNLVDELLADPGKTSRAAEIVLGISEDGYREQDAAEAKGLLDGLLEEVRDVRNQVQNVRLSTVGRIQALVGSKFARGAFATESQQMMDHLLQVENGLNAFLESLSRYTDSFDERYGNLVTPEEPGGVGGAEPPPPPPGEGAGAEPPPPPPGEEAAPAPPPPAGP